MTRRIVPPELVEVGRQALSAVEKSVASGAPLVLCLLAASSFYEALQAELRRTE